MDLSFLKPIYELVQDEAVQKQLESTARIFFTNNSVTVNLIPALIALALASLFVLPLLGIPILDMLGDGMATVASGYGAPSSGYGYAARGDAAYYDQTIADLQEKVAALQESEATLRNAVYYNPVDGTQAGGNIGYST
jgi:hypothetical protein